MDDGRDVQLDPGRRPGAHRPGLALADRPAADATAVRAEHRYGERVSCRPQPRPLTHLTPAAAPAPAPTPAATPQDAAAPAVDPQTAAAVSAALDALVAADVKTSPIGAGDWRAAPPGDSRLLHCARLRAGLVRRGATSPRTARPALGPPRARRRGRARPRRLRLAESPASRRDAGAARRSRDARCRRPWSPTRCRPADRASSRP